LIANTSRINLAIRTDMDGHAKFYIELFNAMKFTHTQLAFSGLRRMWLKKEFGRMYCRLPKVKMKHQINN
jgi:hypothetical protein